MSVISSLLGFIIQQPKPFEADYSGIEYRWKVLVFRPYEFRYEALVLLFFGMMIAGYYLGKKRNEGVAKKWMKDHQALLQDQYDLIIPSWQDQPLSNSPSTIIYYCSGRRNMLSLHITFHLLPRHNLVQLFINFVRGIFDPAFAAGLGNVEDEILLDWTLGEGNKGLQGETVGVWGVCEKGAVLVDLRQTRWDATFPKTLDSSPFLPPSHMLLQETADSTDVLLTANGKNEDVVERLGLKTVLKDGKMMDCLRWCLITDLPIKAPETLDSLSPTRLSRHFILRSRFPSSSTFSNLNPHSTFLQLGNNLIDYLSSPTFFKLLKPETGRKIRKIRQDVGDGMRKELEKDEKKKRDEEKEEERIRKQKEKREKGGVALEEKEKKRAARKAQMKQVKR